jgi:formylglycine-generating enzyme required for sulfatase activity
MSTEENMAPIPGGDIQMRDDRKQTTWIASIKPFELSRFPVTQDQYFSLTGLRPAAGSGAGKPVENVSWFEAVAFCNLASIAAGLSEVYVIADDHAVSVRADATGYRLPTEAEWQHACKAGTKGPLYGELADIAWYRENSGGQTQDVGLKQPNAWGLHDMLGNVWEWCWDIYDEKVYGSYRVFRGGGWNDPERGCLATNRRRGHPTFRIDDLGFRLARGQS